MYSRDEDVIQDLRNGSHKAFNWAFQRFSNSIHTMAYAKLHDQNDAQEVVQLVFKKLWENRESLPEINNFRNYLLTAAVNCSLNLIKTNYRYQSTIEKCADTQSQVQPPDLPMSLKEVHNNVQMALGKIKGGLAKEAFQLSYEGNSHEEIASKMNIPIEVSRSYVSKGRKLVKNFLNKIS
ncbi:RNA polymerase sigma factor [Filimonas effusa]|uniref:Sigma-70 family RNA polymerase sigma factor n=1 Tax=Filimonas effusa TaxID=2508721 RepID=A0A4Q1D1F7_9BACT|nr:sigma-70 family RNA polymerase sigma factor [Filimonas effusa]RXK81685.1 sigma-70 family RNA polymerase sigma factor [Filimonas effusa]